MNIASKRDYNTRFLGLLDSAKTAHFTSVTNEIDNWWMPDDLKTHLLNSAAGDAIAIKQILWGEIIQVPRNQYFDSPAWFNLAYYFVKSPLPLFSISIIGQEPTLVGFVKDIATQFGNISAFALSAWPGLDGAERRRIADNINKDGNFKKMFRGLKLDSNWKSVFKYQRDVLQKILEYIEKNSTDYNLIKPAFGSKTSTWQRIEHDYQDPNFISSLSEKLGESLSQEYLLVLNEIKLKADKDFQNDNQSKNKWLNQRTNLYGQIFSLPKKLRELLRVHIDSRYEETIAESLNAVGRLAISDRSDSQIDLNIRDDHFNILDSVNDPSGLAEKYIIDFDSLKNQTSLNEKVFELLVDREIQERIKRLRRIRNREDLPIDFIVEEEQEHFNVLSRYLPDAIIKKDLRSFEFIYSLTDFCVKVYIGFKLGGILSNILSEIADETIGRVIDKYAEPAKEYIGKFVVNRKKEKITGIVRDWLTKPVQVNQNK